jgi:hypothetical protein
MGNDEREKPEGAEQETHSRAHDLVEEIREEIHEVVEHVPKSVRWTVGKIVRVAVLGFFALVVLILVTIGLYAANRTEWVASELTLFLNQALALRSDVTLVIRDLKGNPLSRVQAIQPSVRFRGSRLPPILEAPSMTVGYSAWGFVTGKPEIEVELESPVVHISEENEMMRFPVWRSGTASTAVTTFDARLRLRNATVILPRDLRVEGLDLDASVHTGKPTRVVLHNLSWRKGPYVERLQSARGQLVAADSVTFSLDELRTPDLDLKAFGGWEAGSTKEVKARHLHLNVERVRWSWLADLFRNQALNVPGEGAAVIELQRETTGEMHGSFLAEVDWNHLEGSGVGNFRWIGDRITLDPLEVTTAAGFLDGRFEMRGKAWELDAAVRDGNPALWGAFGMVGWPEGNLDGRVLYRTAATRAARVQAALGTSRLAGWDADSARVDVRTWPGAPDSFDVWMHRGPGTVELHASADGRGWGGAYAAREYPLAEWPDGRATGLVGVLEEGSGTVAGAGGELQVTGVLAGRSTTWFGAEVGRWRLEDVRGRLLPKPDLAALSRLRDVMFLGVHLDSVQTRAHLGDGSLDVDSLGAFAGDTLVTLDGLATWNDRGWRFEAEGARARSPRFDWRSDGAMVIAGDAHGVRFERMELEDGEARLAMTGRWASPAGRHDFRLDARRVEATRLGLPLEWGLAGSIDASLAFEGAGDDPRWELSGRMVQPGAKGASADSIRVRMGCRAGALDVPELTVFKDGGSLRGHVRVDGTSSPWPDSMDPERIVAWLADAARCNGELVADGFPAGGWGGLLPAASDVSGRANGTLRLKGRPAAPQLELEARLKPIQWRTYDLDEVQARATYADDVLRVPEVRLLRSDVSSTARGELPLRLALGERVRTTDRPMSFEVDVPNGDLSVLPLLVPQIAAAAGPFNMHATLSGTPRDPRLTGTFRVDGGRMRLAGREEEVHDVKARMSFDETRISLESLEAKQGRNGRMNATGTVALEDLKLESYRFEVEARDFVALESGLYSATFDGDFVVTDGERIRGQTLPHVVGEVELLQARILLDFANESEMRQFTSNQQPLFWTYRVQLRATNKLRWEPPNANVEFSADLTLEQSADSLAIFGDVNSLRGRYWFLSNAFNIRRANLMFDNVGGTDPELDIEAETSLRPAAVPTETGGREEDRSAETITVTITGRSRKPVLEFSSSPRDWDQPRILRELTFGQITDERGAVALGDPLDDYVTRAINRQLSVEMSRVFQGYVNEWALRRESGGLFTGEGDLYAEVGIPLTAAWQIRYSQRVPGLAQGTPTYNAGAAPLERDLEVEYRLSRFFFVTSEVLQRRVPTGSANSSSGPEFNVNLKARWEY